MTAARDAARSAERGGQAAVALRALLDAVRLGDIRAIDGITRVGQDVDCVVGQVAQAHARALASGDAAALGEVSKRLGALGMNRAAEDAAAQAADS